MLLRLLMVAMLAFMVSLGCNDEIALHDGFEADLTETFGCGDIFIAARNEADTIALFYRHDGGAAQAHEQGEPVVFSLNIPDEAVTLEAQLGTFLTMESCNDTVDMNRRPAVDVTYSAVSGTVVLTVTPTGEPSPWESPASADLTLTNVVFESTDGDHSVTVSTFEESGIHVGWLPG